MATKTTKKAALKIQQAKGSGKSVRSKCIALLKSRPHSVEELKKKLGISAVHVRSILYVVDPTVVKQPAKYSL